MYEIRTIKRSVVYECVGLRLLHSKLPCRGLGFRVGGYPKSPL